MKKKCEMVAMLRAARTKETVEAVQLELGTMIGREGWVAPAM